MRSFHRIKYSRFCSKPSKETNHISIIGVLTRKEKGDDHTISEKVGFGHNKNTKVIGWPEDKNKSRTFLIATLEYEIINWKLEVKIGVSVSCRAIR